MNGPNQKILLATLWERTSAKGNTYLSGFFGKAPVVAFRGKPTPAGTPTWDVYLTPGLERGETNATASPPRTQPAPYEPPLDDSVHEDWR